jgi:hypothetical protein
LVIINKGRKGRRREAHRKYILIIYMVKVDGREYEKSTRKGKKLMVEVDGKTIHFGDSSRQHFRDRTGIWKEKNHGDKTRRKNYLTRSAGIKDGKGNLTKDNPLSPNYHSRRILW